MKTLDTKEFAAMKGVSVQRVGQVLKGLSILRSQIPITEAGKARWEKRVSNRLRWLGETYIDHCKKGGVWIIRVTG